MPHAVNEAEQQPADDADLGAGDEGARLGVPQNSGLAEQVVFDLGEAKWRIDRHGDRPGEQNSEKSDEEVAARRQHNRDPIARANSPLDQASRRGASFVLKIPVGERLGRSRAFPQKHVFTLAVTSRVRDNRIDQGSGFDWLFHGFEVRRLSSGAASHFGDRGGGGENCSHQVIGAVGLADQAFRKLHLERAIESQKQLGAREAVESQIPIEVAV